MTEEEYKQEWLNGMHQTEYIRTAEQYKIARDKIVNILNNL